MSNPFNSVIEAAMQNKVIAKPGDYRDEEGLLCCGVCRKRRERSLKGILPGIENVIVPCICACEEKESNEAAEASRAAERCEEAYRLPVFALHCAKACTFDQHDDTNEKALEAAQVYVKYWTEQFEEGTGLLFWGDNGTGKSFVSSCIVNALRAQGVPCLMTSTTRLIDKINAGKVDPLELNRFDLLVLDDFGAERQTPYVLEQLRLILDDRIQENLPLILSTNLSVEQLRAPENMELRRIYDRVAEVTIPVQFTGKSHRADKGRNRLDHFKKLIDQEKDAG